MSMNEETNTEAPLPQDDVTMPEKSISFPWGLKEVIYAVLAMILISVGIVVAVELWELETNAVLIIYEAIYLLPVLVVMLIKKAPWGSLGIKNFSFENLLIGFGILFAVYIVIIIHNLALVFMGITPQAEYLAELFGMDVNLWVLGISIVIIKVRRTNHLN